MKSNFTIDWLICSKSWTIAGRLSEHHSMSAMHIVLIFVGLCLPHWTQSIEFFMSLSIQNTYRYLKCKRASQLKKKKKTWPLIEIPCTTAAKIENGSVILKSWQKVISSKLIHYYSATIYWSFDCIVRQFLAWTMQLLTKKQSTQQKRRIMLQKFTSKSKAKVAILT